MSVNKTEVEKMAKQLHVWYLEATRNLNPKSYNSKAQKSYEDLTEEQKKIDRYIALRVLIDKYKSWENKFEGFRKKN